MVATTTHSLWAQPTAANARAAQLLFDEAKQLADQKDYAKACPKFVQSHQLDPAGGTILHAADCHEHQGKLASAWAEYNEALSFAIRAARADRESISRARIDALTPKLAKIRVQLAPGSKTLEGFGVWLDGTQIGESGPLLDAPIPVDSGPHTLEARATGHVTATQRFTIEDGQERTVSFGELAAVPETHDTAAPSRPVVRREAGLGAQRIAGAALLGAGGIGLILGAAFGLHAVSIGDQSDQCRLGPDGNGCPGSAVDAQDRARTSGTVSTVGFIAGGVLAAGGAVLLFTAPPRDSRRSARPLRVGVGRGLSLTLAGEF